MSFQAELNSSCIFTSALLTKHAISFLIRTWMLRFHMSVKSTFRPNCTFCAHFTFEHLSIMFKFDMIFFGISTSARKRAIITEKPSVAFYFFTACCVKVRTTLKSTHNLISGNSIFPPYFQMNLIEVLFKFALVVVSFVTLTTSNRLLRFCIVKLVCCCSTCCFNSSSSVELKLQ